MLRGSRAQTRLTLFGGPTLLRGNPGDIVQKVAEFLCFPLPCSSWCRGACEISAVSWFPEVCILLLVKVGRGGRWGPRTGCIETTTMPNELFKTPMAVARITTRQSARLLIYRLY